MPWLRSLFPFCLLVAVPLFLPSAAGAGYCDDAERVLRWEELSRKNPRDFGVQALDALRIGLCQKVQGGLLAEREALEILWSARSRLFDQNLDARLERFLEREADRTRTENTLQSKLDRTQQDYDDAHADYEEVALAVRELSLNQMQGDEEYRNRCAGVEAGRASSSVCRRLQRRLDDLRREAPGLQKDLVAAEEKRRQAAQRLAEAQRRLKK